MTAILLRPPPPLSAEASARIDLLRLLLIAQVICGHLAMIAYPTFGQLDLSLPADLFVALWRLATRFGGQAAVVFICLSGYFLAPRLVAIGLRDAGAPPLSAFIRGRLWRIYPTLIAALVLTLACDLAGVYLLGAEPLYRRVASYDAIATLSPAVGFANLFSLQPTFAPSFGTNGPLWTLGYIVQFYVAAALLTAIMRWDRRAAALALVLLLAAAWWYFPAWPLLFATWLGCGMVRWARPGDALQGWAAIAAGMALIVIANLADVLAGFALSGIAGMALAYGMAADLRPAGPSRLPTALVRLNEASFALYAFHFPLAVLVYAAIAPLVDQSGLAFRLGWPILALVPALLLALAFQSALNRIAGDTPR